MNTVFQVDFVKRTKGFLLFQSRIVVETPKQRKSGILWNPAETIETNGAFPETRLKQRRPTLHTALPELDGVGVWQQKLDLRFSTQTMPCLRPPGKATAQVHTHTKKIKRKKKKARERKCNAVSTPYKCFFCFALGCHSLLL